MAKYYSKEEREVIERLNNILGMKHRSRPFDFTNVDDLKEAFTYIVAEYIDYMNYYMSLVDIMEHFDESLEYYDPVTWTSLHDNNVKGDELAQEVSTDLDIACGSLREIANRSEEKCDEMLTIILGMDAIIRESVLGKRYIYDEDAIKNIFSDCVNINNTYSVEESRDAFIKVLDEHLSVEDD